MTNESFTRAPSQPACTSSRRQTAGEFFRPNGFMQIGVGAVSHSDEGPPYRSLRTTGRCEIWDEPQKAAEFGV